MIAMEALDQKNDVLADFLKSEKDWLTDIIVKYPRQIPIAPIAEHWGCAVESVRAAIEQDPTFGVFWRRVGAANKAYLIPTGLFVQWYCKTKF